MKTSLRAAARSEAIFRIVAFGLSLKGAVSRRSLLGKKEKVPLPTRIDAQATQVRIHLLVGDTKRIQGIVQLVPQDSSVHKLGMGE